MRRTLSLTLIFALVFSAMAPLAFAAKAKKTEDGAELFKNRYAKKEGAINLQRAIEIAMENNTSIQIAQKNAQIYDQQVRQYWSYVYPKLTVSGNYTRTIEPQEAIVPAFGGKIRMGTDNTTSATAEATLLLWKGGAVKSGVKMGKLYSQSGDFQLTEVQNQIKDSVTTLFLGIVLSNALIKVQEENLNIAKDHLHEINLKYKQGLASDLDILNQKVKVSNSEPPLIQAKNSYDLGILTLKRVLNIDPDQEISLDWEVGNVLATKVPLLEDLYQMARENKPDLVIARLNTDIAEQQIKIAKADHYGEITAFINGTYSGGSDSVLIPVSSDNSSKGANAGLRISIPLFEGFRVNSVVNQKKLAYDQALLTQLDTERYVKIEIQKALLNFNEAKQRILSTQGTIQQARKNLNSTQLRYRNGLASRLDLDDSALLLHDAELQFVQAVHDAFAAISNLSYAVGKEVTKQ